MSSSTNPEHRTTWQRLASARHRVRAFLEQVQNLQASSFPHPDGKEALELIEAYFAELLNSLDLPEDCLPDVADQLCAHSAMALSRYTRVLGFILRSTNVRNAFEIHHPLKRIVTKLLGSDAKVLISSEWDFVPFTYPMSLDVLPKFALLGGPATESNNVLILPLAGHEIGHSVWRSIKAADAEQVRLASSIDQIFVDEIKSVNEIIDEWKIGSLGVSRLKQILLSFGIKQLEEIFCDAIGLGIFSKSFLYSFEYFMAPGGSTRSFKYPSDLDRIKFLKIGCDKIGLPPDPALFDRWKESRLNDSMDKRIVKLLDQAVGQNAGGVIELALITLKSNGIASVDLNNVSRIEKSFERREPEDERGTIAEIVCAGWETLRTMPTVQIAKEHQEHKFVGELMLKSIEISEFRGRLEGHA